MLPLLYIIALVLPWLVLLFLPGGSIPGLLLFWMAVIFSLILIWSMTAARRRAEAVASPSIGPRMLNEIEQPEVVRQVMDVKIALEVNSVQSFRGPLREAAEGAYRKLSQAFSDRAVPLIQEDDK